MGITERVLSAPPFFVEVGFLFPSPLEFTQQGKAAIDVVKRALCALEITNGITHTELVLPANRNEIPKIIEVNARPAGGIIPSLINHAIGLDIHRLYIDLQLRKSLLLTPTKKLFASAYHFTAIKNGHVLDVQGYDELSKHPQVREAKLSVKSGDKVIKPKSNWDRLGQFITVSEDYKQLVAVSEDLLKSVLFKIEN